MFLTMISPIIFVCAFAWFPFVNVNNFHGRWSWLSGIQQDKKTMTDCVHCPILTLTSSSCASPSTVQTVSVGWALTFFSACCLLGFIDMKVVRNLCVATGLPSQVTETLPSSWCCRIFCLLQRTSLRSGLLRSNISVPMFPSSWWGTKRTCVMTSTPGGSLQKWSR